MSKIRVVIYLFITTVLVGTIGFKVVGGESWSILDSLYMTVITLSTVGFQEVHNLEPGGKIWTIIVISLGIGIVAYAVSQAKEFIQNFDRFRRRKMIKKVSRLKNHFIVCGYGRMGKVICKELQNEDLLFVIIENNREKIPNIEDKGYLVVNGDATLDETLELAQIKKAKGLAVVLSHDTDNLFVTMTAKTINQELFIISRSSEAGNAVKFVRAGANKVVNPYEAGGHKISQLLIAPYIEDSMEIKTPSRTLELLMEEIKLENCTKYEQVPIKLSRIREDFQLLIAGIVHEDDEIVFNPDPKTKLNCSQTLMLIGEKESLRKFKDMVKEEQT